MPLPGDFFIVSTRRPQSPPPLYSSAGSDVYKKQSKCWTKCGAPATRTQRIINGKPASFNDPIVLVGAKEAYEPRCRHCHEIVEKPIKFENQKKIQFRPRK